MAPLLSWNSSWHVLVGLEWMLVMAEREEALTTTGAFDLFDAHEDFICISGAQAARLLEQVPPSPDPHEASLKDILQAALRAYPDAGRPPARLRRYRYWDPIYVPNRVSPSHGPWAQPVSVPLGIVCGGVAEIIDPSTVLSEELSGPTDMARLINPTNRIPTQADQIDGILFPGTPIGLFETTDRVFNVHLEHKTYTLFAGTRSIQPCVSSDRKDTIERWVAERRRRDAEFLKGGNGKTTSQLVRSVLAFLQSKSHAGSENIVRLLFRDVFPTPWSTTIMYFSAAFVDGLNDDDKRLITALAWKRMSETFERTAIVYRDDSALGFRKAQILASVTEAALGKSHCLMLGEQCPEVLENTGLEGLLREYCRWNGLYDPDTPVFVPGYLRKAGDWGLICQRAYDSRMDPAKAKALRTVISQEVDRLSTKAFEAIYIEDADQVPHTKLPKHVCDVFGREVRAKKQRAKFLIPSILLRRTA